MRRAALPRSSGMALVLLAVAGCGDRLPPLATISSVSPASGPVDQSLTVQIEGEGFAVRVFTDFGDPTQSYTDDTYEVTIGGIALTGVQHLSTTQLTGTLPAGVAQGGNDLQVTDPWERTATLAAAYFGIPAGGLPAALAILAPANVPIGTCQAVTVEQRNSSGSPTVSLDATAVALVTSPAAAFGVFADNGCTTAATAANIDVGQTSVTVYVLATDRVTADLGVSATGLTSDSHTFTFGPTQIAFTNTTVSGLVGVCVSTALTVQTRNPAGAASAVATDTSITLSAPINLLLYDAAGCLTPTVSSITIPAGSSSASFYVKGLSQGSPVVTASASAAGLGTDTQTVTVSPNTNFVFESVGPQGVATPFLVSIRADDGAGNVVTTFASTAVLTGQGGTTLTCVSNCGNGTTTLSFIRGKWSGWVRANTAVSGATIHAASGTITGDSNAFDVLAPGAFSAPTARLSVTPGAVNSTSDVVVLNASLSSTYGQGTLEYSFDPQGTAASAPGTAPWSSWGPASTFNGSNYSAGVWQPRVAVRRTGDTVVSIGTATVVSTSTLLCTVTTNVFDDDGADSCSMSNKFGTDGEISLPEAIKITNGGGGRAITADQAYRFVYVPGNDLYPVINSTSLSFPTGTQLIDIPLDLDNAGVMLANAEITGTRPWTVSSGDFTLRDAVVHDHAGILTGAQLTLQRVLMLRCASGAPCVTATGPSGLVRSLFSEFVDAPGDALRILPATSGGPCPAPAVDVQSSTFTRASIAINTDCTSGARVVHATFHANGTGIEYVGGSANTLQNNIFSNNTTATTCAAATFANGKDYNLLFGNGTDGCVAGDTFTLSGDPLYFIPGVGDFRVRSTSPAYDTATNLSLDVNDVGPGSFYGAGPDRGGRETP